MSDSPANDESNFLGGLAVIATTKYFILKSGQYDTE